MVILVGTDTAFSEDISLLQHVHERGVSAVVVINAEGKVEWATESKWFESLLNGVTATEAHVRSPVSLARLSSC